MLSSVNRFILKFCTVLALSLALAYSGVAWAVASCWTDREHTTHAEVDNRDDPQPPLERDGSRDPTVPFIHCASPLHEPGPAVIVASTIRNRSSKAVPIHESLLPRAISREFERGLWLQSVFKEVSRYSFLSNSSRHLYLSVLQI